jgi:uncharacterized protein (UPF0335 family)
MLTKTNARLQFHADRIRRLEEERLALAADTKEALEEAKAEGFTPSALKKAIKIHAMDKSRREKHDAEQMDLELYLAQLDGKEIEGG